MLTELKLVVTWVYSQDVQVIRAHNPLPNHVATAILATSKNIIHSAGTKMTSVAIQKKKMKQSNPTKIVVNYVSVFIWGVPSGNLT